MFIAYNREVVSSYRMFCAKFYGCTLHGDETANAASNADGARAHIALFLRFTCDVTTMTTSTTAEVVSLLGILSPARVCEQRVVVLRVYERRFKQDSH